MRSFKQTAIARVVRRVTLAEDGSISVDDTPGANVSVQISPTAVAKPTRDAASPRGQRTHVLRHPLPPYGLTDPLKAGDRLLVVQNFARDKARPLLEVVAHSGDFRVGVPWNDGQSVAVRDVHELYPYYGMLIGPDGQDVTDLSFSLWSSDENSTDQGVYEDYSAEVPISFHDQVRVNHTIQTPAMQLKVVNASVDRDGGFVDLTLRKANAAKS